MTSVDDIRWGSYKGYEGPWYPGIIKYELPENPTESHKTVAVITATEGGALDAINRYDRCIDTQGVIQWCNRAPMFFVDQIYKEVGSAHLLPIQAIAASRGYAFDVAKGKFTSPTRGWIDTPEKQVEMYFAGASGRKGQWADEQKQYAKEWVAAAADVWKTRYAQNAQLVFTLQRLNRFFVFGQTATHVLSGAAVEATDLSLAFRAAYFSFAANNPKKASEALEHAMDGVAGRSPMFGLNWLTAVLSSLTFHPGISIYPHRYNKIRPVLEKLFSIDLPDFAEDIRNYTSRFPERFMDPLEVQRALKILGYDLGPRGPDGIFGAKSRDALRAFELDNGVPPHAVDGILDQHTLELLEQELQCRGIKDLDAHDDS